jgi:sarcosine oxidase subunit gamma
MPDATPRRESPLTGRIPDPATPWRRGGITMRERAFLGHVNLRGDCGASAFAQGAAAALGGALPVVPNTVAAFAQRTVFWLGPDEWLVVCPGNDERALVAQFERAFSGLHASVVGLSGGQTVLDLEGEGVRDLLARGCPLDLHPRVFGAGRCAQTHIAKAPVLMRPVSGGMEIVVRRSYADYLWQWLDTVAT